MFECSFYENGILKSIRYNKKTIKRAQTSKVLLMGIFILISFFVVNLIKQKVLSTDYIVLAILISVIISTGSFEFLSGLKTKKFELTFSEMGVSYVDHNKKAHLKYEDLGLFGTAYSEYHEFVQFTKSRIRLFYFAPKKMNQAEVEKSLSSIFIFTNNVSKNEIIYFSISDSQKYALESEKYQEEIEHFVNTAIKHFTGETRDTSSSPKS